MKTQGVFFFHFGKGQPCYLSQAYLPSKPNHRAAAAAARRPPKHCLRRIPTPPPSCCYTIPPPHALPPPLYHSRLVTASDDEGDGGRANPHLAATSCLLVVCRTGLLSLPYSRGLVLFFHLSDSVRSCRGVRFKVQTFFGSGVIGV